MQRAADYLGAAADLLDTRDRRSLTAEQRSFDANQITPHLTAAGCLVAATTTAHPALRDNTTSVSSLVDVSTVASAPSHTAGTVASSAVAGADATSAALAAVHGALHGWQRGALAVAHQPAPSSSDLLGCPQQQPSPGPPTPP